MAFAKIPLFLCVTLMLARMTAGSPRPMNRQEMQDLIEEEMSDMEERVFPPVESINDTMRDPSYSVKRFIDNTRACQEVYSRLNPQEYFNTKDTFVPRYVYTVKCEGTATNPPTCGVSSGRMRCMTRMGNVEFMRMPRGIGQCFRRRRVTISDVPVGCYCV